MNGHSYIPLRRLDIKTCTDSILNGSRPLTYEKEIDGEPLEPITLASDMIHGSCYV